jgi:hypothetical protein
MTPPAGIPPTAVEIPSPTPQMLNALADSAGFQSRFRGLLATMTAQILNTAVGSGSPPVTAGQQTYARGLVSNPGYATVLLAYFVHRPNLASANIWVDLSGGVCDLYSDATDAAILSQLATDWPSVSGS